MLATQAVNTTGKATYDTASAYRGMPPSPPSPPPPAFDAAEGRGHSEERD